MYEVKKEITGKRDEALMKLHGDKGFYYSDLPFINCGYNLGEPKLLEIYIKRQDYDKALNTPCVKVLTSFSRSNSLPSLLISYDLDFKSFDVKIVDRQESDLNGISERELVCDLLYKYRGSQWESEDDYNKFIKYISNFKQDTSYLPPFYHYFISARHREYGYNCPINDFDFLLLDTEESCLKAVIEYKSSDYINHIPLRILKMYSKIGDLLGVPVFRVIHSNFNSYIVHSFSNLATEIITKIVEFEKNDDPIPSNTLSFDEEGYFKFLNILRIRQNIRK